MSLVQSKQVTSDLHSRSSGRWIVLCDTVLLFLVTFFCGMVLYEIRSMDQRFISVLDSSSIAIDLMSVDLIESHFQPVWSEVNDELNVYSAFYDSGKQHVLIIGSSVHSEILLEGIRCLVQYEDGDMSLVNVDYRKESECSTVFVYCFLERSLTPLNIALVSVENTIPKQWMNVEILPEFQYTKQSTKVAACVQPLTQDVTPHALKSFITVKELSGVKEFYIYYHNVSYETLDTFIKLTSEGHFLHLLRWNKEENAALSNKCPNELNEFVQDCSHRSLGKHKYINVVPVSVSIRHLLKMPKSMLVKNVTDIAKYSKK